jgi:chromate reductase, NAD(P)H dehydrogenase (quinone)
MSIKKEILIIIGSASKQSSNHKLIDYINGLWDNQIKVIVYDKLSELPHFSPEDSIANTPESVLSIRNMIEKADGVVISTPEYIFSIPSCFKNLMEWCVSTTIFSNKPVGLITASAHGMKGHEELHLIMETLGGVFTKETAILIQGIKGKIDKEGNILHENTALELQSFVKNFERILFNSPANTSLK